MMQMPPGHFAADIAGITSEIGLSGDLGSTAPLTFYTAHDTPRAPHNSDGLCGSRYCNGYDAKAYGVQNGLYNNKDKSARGGFSCYRDTDCQFYVKDSSGQLLGEVVGKCVRRSYTLSMCECEYPYFGNNCEFKNCPKASAGHQQGAESDPGEPSSLGPRNIFEAGDSGGGASERHASAPFVGAVLGVGRDIAAGGRTIRDNKDRGTNAMEGFECGGERGNCDYGTGACVCKPGFHGRACQFRTAANGCSTTGVTTRNCRSPNSLRHHGNSVDALLQPEEVKHNLGCGDIRNGACAGVVDAARYAAAPLVSLTQSVWGPVNTKHNAAGHAGHNVGHSAFNPGNVDNIYAMEVQRDATTPHPIYTNDTNSYPSSSYT